jgi:hypothetical protein
MDVVGRAREIVLSPGPTWVTIEQEETDLQQLYVPYMVALAAIPAVAGFIGWSLVGVGGFGFSMRIPVVSGLGLMVTNYVMTLVMVFVWGWLISQLASTFGGQPKLLNGVKLSVYASTPAMLAGVFSAIPSLAMIAVLGGLYSLYLVFQGLPVLMKNPKEKSIPYLLVCAIIGIVCSVVLSMFSSLFMPSHLSAMQGMNGAGNVNISTPKGDVQISTTQGGGSSPDSAAVTIKTPDGEVKLDMKNMEEMAKKIQAQVEEQEKAAKK